MQWGRRLLLLWFWLGVTAGVLSSGCATLARRTAADPADAAGALPAGGAARDVALVSYTEPARDGAPEEAADQDESRERDPLKWSDFAPDNLGMTIRRLTGRGPDRNVARTLYGAGEDAYRQAVALRDRDPEADVTRLFLDASDQYAEAAQRWPDSALEEDALFRAGESQFFADRYVKANHYFELLVKKYPNTRYLDLVGARRFLIAQYWLKRHDEPRFPNVGINLTDDKIPWIDTFGHAIRIYDRMRLDDPTGKLADDATIAAANAHFVKGKYDKADQYYSDLRTHFPSSEHQFNAHYLGIQAKLRGYHGPRYTGDSLEETDKLIQQIRRQFPQQAREHRDELDKAARQVRYLMAEREWLMAQYYVRRQEYGAARFYLDIVLKNYHDTPFAEQAREEIGQLAGKPRVPPQRMAWLVNLFPDSDTAKPLLATAPGDTKVR